MPISDDDKEQVRNYIITEPFTTLLESNRQQIDRQQQVTDIVRRLRNKRDLKDLNRFISATRETYVSLLQWQAIGKRVAEEFFILLIPIIFAFTAKYFTKSITDAVNLSEKPGNSVSPEIIAGLLGYLIMRKILQPHVENLAADPPAVTRLKNRASFVENLIQEKILELASANESSSQLRYRRH